MKRIFILFAFLLSFSSFAAKAPSACGQADPDDSASFCPSFAAIAACHCTESGVPAGKCSDMNFVYNIMIARFITLDRACEYQTDTTKQACIDDWNCYRQGGVDSNGKLCSSVGRACQ